MSGFKDLGPNVSQSPQDTSVGGQFSGEEKAFESVVIQEGAPVIDWEMNLRTDVQNDHGLRLNNQRLSPSCFLDGDFLERADILGSYVMLAALIGNENKFRIRAQNAIVNGWPVRAEYSDIVTAGLNEVVLTAPPVAGGRTDVVILEAWRALVRATPSTANKSPTALLLRHGNVKAPDAVNLTDDLIDPTYALESNARVQIQYRLRVVEGVNLDTYPDGLDDPTVVAHTVSDFSGPGADGTATARAFSPFPGDGGLWIAGNGDLADAALLGTVDGFMYAVPVCAVARRNTTAFSRSTNMNGGVLIASGTSDRPDGLFSDQVAAEDILDMRRGCARDFQEVMDKASQQIFDNSLTTRLEATALGTSGTSALYRDDVAFPASGKMGVTDGARRHFSDRSVTEVMTCRVTLGIGQNIADFRLDLGLKQAWNPTPLAGIAGLMSTGATIKGFGRVRVVRTAALTDEDGLDTASSIWVFSSSFDTNTGPQVDTLRLVFNALTIAVTDIYVDVFVEIPSGFGTSRNMLRAHDMWVPLSPPGWVDTSFITASSDGTRGRLDSSLWGADPSHRELAIHYQSDPQAGVIFYTTATDELLIWERLNGDPITITDGTNPPYPTTNYTSNTAYTRVQLTGGVPITAGAAVSVDYVAFRPIPAGSFAPNDSYNLFYQTAAIQSLLPPAGTQTLDLIPRAVSKQLFVIGSSTGSPDNPFPYLTPGEQVPVGALPAPDFPESVLDGPADISVIGFGANTGFLQLPVYVPYAPNPADVTLFRDAPDAVTDAEGRNFWPKSDSGVPAKYSPVLFGPELSGGRRHKVAAPALMELKSDFPSVGRKGTLVLILLTNWMDFDPATKVVLTPVVDSSGAGVFRVRGNMLNPRRADP